MSCTSKSMPVVALWRSSRYLAFVCISRYLLTHSVLVWSNTIGILDVKAAVQKRRVNRAAKEETRWEVPPPSAQDDAGSVWSLTLTGCCLARYVHRTLLAYLAA
ncbi:hypothetical protein LX36DRAFT_309382 [Colletotrichum falcatum]|nr:hypothetical protein LX36DRAFT_309382 [Colletotrichum falcatum]